MAYYLVELYSPKPAWAALDQAARAEFFAAIGAGMEALSDLGATAVTLTGIEPGVEHSVGQQFLAIWRCPDKESAETLVAGISASGWHDYFETQNAIGSEGDFPAHLAELSAL